MDTKNVLSALGALAQESRLAVFRLLVQAGPVGMAATKISEHLGVPPSSLSFHLKEMAHADLVTSRQESRFVIYSANFKTMTGLVHFLTENCCGGTPCAPVGSTAGTLNVLFLCTGNSARSIMAEALVTILGKGRFKGFSAGSKPGGKVNPFAIEQIKNFDPAYPTSEMRSKSWDEFARPDAPHMDFIITVCDNAAAETCPYWPGHPATAHWGFEDPAAVKGSDEAKRAAFKQVFNEIMNRMRAFVTLPIASMDDNAIRQATQKIGEIAL